MLGVLAYLTIATAMIAGILHASFVFAVLAAFILPAISFAENRDTYFGICDRHYVGRNIIAWVLLKSLMNGAAASIGAYAVGAIARQIWL